MRKRPAGALLWRAVLHGASPALPASTASPRGKTVLLRDKAALLHNTALMLRDTAPLLHDKGLMSRDEAPMLCNISVVLRDETLMSRGFAAMLHDEALLLDDAARVSGSGPALGVV